MATYVTTIKNRKAVFTDNYIQIENLILYYDKMSNIRYKIGQSGFAFEYNGKNVLIPCEANEKDKMMPFFSKAVTLERQRKARELTLDDFSFNELDSKSKESTLKEQEPIKSASMEMPTMTIPPISMESNAFENNNQPINIQQTASQKFDPFANMQIDNNKPNKKSANTNEITTDIKSFWETCKLVISIISMVLFIPIILQHCADGVSFILGLFILIAGIIGITTRKSIKKGSCIASAILCSLGSLFASLWCSSIPDLRIWEAIAIIFSIFYIFFAIKAKNHNKNKLYIIGYIIYGLILLFTILLLIIPSVVTSENSNTSNNTLTNEYMEQIEDTSEKEDWLQYYKDNDISVVYVPQDILYEYGSLYSGKTVVTAITVVNTDDNSLAATTDNNDTYFYSIKAYFNDINEKNMINEGEHIIISGVVKEEDEDKLFESQKTVTLEDSHIITKGITEEEIESNREEQKSYATKQEEKQIKERYTNIDIETLFSDLDNNAASASDKYKNNYYAVNGILGTIDSDGSYIYLESDNNDYMFESITCSIKNEEQLKTIKKLSKGDRIIVKGKITSVGEFLGYRIDIDYIEKQ